MSVPTYEQLIGPLLLFLAEREEPVKPAQAYERLAEVVGISEEDKRELVPSGIQPIYKNRIGWAQDALKRNHLSWSPKWGRWQITDEGKEFVKRHGGVVPDDEAHKIALRNRNKPLAEILDTSALEDVSEQAQPDEEGVQSPEDKIDEGLEEIRASVARELLELVLRGSPEFFEQLVLDLLHAMGYGASRKALQRVGGAGDGGIDGIISLDRLGLEKVYVQAKKWKGRVGSPEVRGFVGALQLNGANKGVLITSGKFSKSAIEAANLARVVVLIDGETLSSLMIEHQVGVSNRSIKLPRVDSDYFEE